jgi:hypothetical protein
MSNNKLPIQNPPVEMVYLQVGSATDLVLRSLYRAIRHGVKPMEAVSTERFESPFTAVLVKLQERVKKFPV